MQLVLYDHENFYIFGKLSLIPCSHVYVNQVKDKGIGYTWVCVDQVHHKVDKIIHYDLLKFSKYGYTYKFKYSSGSLEKFQW